MNWRERVAWWVAVNLDEVYAALIGGVLGCIVGLVVGIPIGLLISRAWH